MRIFLILLFIFSSQTSLAENISESLKKDKVIEALEPITKNLDHLDIKIESNIFSTNLRFQQSKFFESGDKEIYYLLADTVINGDKFSIECDLMAGEYGQDRTIYFLIYESCYLINMDSYRKKPIRVPAQFWQDWKY